MLLALINKLFQTFNRLWVKSKCLSSRWGAISTVIYTFHHTVGIFVKAKIKSTVLNCISWDTNPKINVSIQNKFNHDENFKVWWKTTSVLPFANKQILTFKCCHISADIRWSTGHCFRTMSRTFSSDINMVINFHSNSEASNLISLLDMEVSLNGSPFKWLEAECFHTTNLYR